MSQITPVVIANMALTHIAQGQFIESLTETRTPAARHCRTWYDTARQTVLEAHDWGFARRLKTLAEHGEDPPDDWGYRYALPAGALVVRAIWNPLGDRAPPIPFKIAMADTSGDTTILTNQSEAKAWVTTDVIDASKFMAHFTVTLSHLLACLIAYAITGKESVQKRQWDLYQGFLRVAPAVNANQGMPEEPDDAPWIKARSGGSTV